MAERRVAVCASSRRRGLPGRLVPRGSGGGWLGRDMEWAPAFFVSMGNSMRAERRGRLYLIMFVIVLLALFALMEALRMLVSVQIERQEDRREREDQSRGLNPPERRP